MYFTVKYCSFRIQLHSVGHQFLCFKFGFFDAFLNALQCLKTLFKVSIVIGGHDCTPVTINAIQPE